MSSKIFKKLIAGAATLSMVAQFGFVLPASAADPVVKVPLVDYEGTDDEVKFEAKARFENSIITSAKGTNTTKVESITGSGSSNGYGIYTPLSADDAAGHIVTYEFDVCFVGRICYLSLSNGADRDANDSGRALTISYDANDGKIYANGSQIGTAPDTWYHIVADANNVLKTVDWKSYAYNADGDYSGTAAYSGTSNYRDGNIDVTGFDFFAPNMVGLYIDNIKISTTESNDTVNTLTYVVNEGPAKGTYTENVLEGGSPTMSMVPDTAREGYIFNGWIVDGNESNIVSTADIKASVPTQAVTYTAKYSVDPAYIHKIANVEISTTKTDAIIPKTVQGESEDFTYTAKVTSQNGEEIPPEKCTFTWKVVGNEADDSYTTLTQSQTNPETATFNVLAGVSNYYGYIQVDVSYDPDNSENEEDNSTGKAVTPYVILASTATSNFIPDGGYPENYNDYADTLVGYVSTNVFNQKYEDLLLDASIYGSNNSRTLSLKKGDDGDKYLEFSTGGGSGSTVGIYQWPSNMTKAYIVDTVINLPADAGMTIADNTTNNGFNAEASFKMTSGGIQVGESTISGTTPGNWYRILLIGDPTNNKHYVKVYDETGTNFIGETEIATGASAAPWLLNLSGAFPIGVKSIKAYNPTPVKMTISGDETVQVPETGTATAEFAEVCYDKDDNKILTNPVWSLDEDYGDAVEINASTGVLTIKPGASGTVTVKAAIGSLVAEHEVVLSTSGNVINMKGSSSITIPFAGEPNATATYTAVTLDKDGNPVADDKITYSFLDKDNQPLSKLPNGINFNEKTGVLTVAAGATPGVIYLKATNSTDNMSNKLRINIHGMSFSFGAGEPAEGDTQVTSDLQYTDKLGFGFEDVSALTDEAAAVKGTADYKFKVAVPNGNYKVNVTTTSESMNSEVIDGIDAATGIYKSGSEFNVAVCDGVLDLTFLSNSTLSSLSISQIANKAALEKPAIYAIGDSTTKNGNGANSWGEVASEYVNSEKFSGFSNHGKAGDDSVVYYNSGRVENVLLSVCKGDYVTINMGINSKTSGEATSYDTLMRNYYIAGVIQRGAIPVILTHTPQGPVGSYASSNYSDGVFKTARTGQHNDDLRQYAEDYNLNLVDVSNYVNNYFNSLTDADVANSELWGSQQGFGADNPPQTKLDLVQSWFKDHNHYDRPLSDKIAQYVLSELENIVENPFEIASVTKAVNGNEITLTATTPENATKGSKDLDVMVAQYDADGVLIGVEKKTVTFSSATDGLTAGVTYTPNGSAASTKVFVWGDNLKPYLVDTAVTTTTP
ncbi:MAG: hypothetical protein ACI4A5_11685 [Hominilimicola sp.]